MSELEPKVGDKVEVIGIGPGRIVNIRHDDRQRAIYTIKLTDVTETPSDFFVARREEFCLELPRA